jgi:hypothetical protein
VGGAKAISACLTTEMFLSVKFNYKKRFGENLIFRLIGMDLSWATIHAGLNILNLETIEE